MGSWRRSKGQALVEFALVLPVLLLVIVAVFDFGRAFLLWNNITHIASDGARYSIVNVNPGASSNMTLQKYLQQQGTTSALRSCAGVSMSLPNGTSLAGDPVKVAVSFRFDFGPFLDPIRRLTGSPNLGKVTIVGDSTMRLEQSLDGTNQLANNIAIPNGC